MDEDRRLDADDPRLLGVPRGVRWMYLEGLVWCNQHGTDGFIPDHALRRVTDEEDPGAAADQLVGVGLWVVGNGGWEIVDFTKDQPSAADVERTQKLAASASASSVSTRTATTTCATRGTARRRHA